MLNLERDAPSHRVRLFLAAIPTSGYADR